MALPADRTSYDGSLEKHPGVGVHLPPLGSNQQCFTVVEAPDRAHVELSLPPSLQRMPKSLKRIYLTANGSSKLDGSGRGFGSCGASWRSGEDSAAALGAGAGGTGSRKDAASCGASWHSAEDSAAALGEGGKAPAGAATKGAANCGSDGVDSCGSSSLSLYDEVDAEDFWGEPYGADTWRRPWRRPEGLAGCWVLLALLGAVAINLGVGISNSQKAAARLPAASRTAASDPAALDPTLAAGPALQPEPRQQLVPAGPLPPPPPPPPPAYCEVGGGAPANLARSRFSNLMALFPAPPQHYAANLVDHKAGHSATRYPAYYNGVVPRFCIVVVQALYTCLREDNPCNYSPEVSLRLCESACPDSANGCQGVAGVAGHPLQTRTCGLFGLSKPSCINIGFTAGRQRMMRAYYKVKCGAGPDDSSTPQACPGSGSIAWQGCFCCVMAQTHRANSSSRPCHQPNVCSSTCARHRLVLCRRRIRRCHPLRRRPFCLRWHRPCRACQPLSQVT
ncbi:hypothetical protein ABPG77_008061 [Micractinium sp. CCAP 211/92]